MDESKISGLRQQSPFDNFLDSTQHQSKTGFGRMHTQMSRTHQDSRGLSFHEQFFSDKDNIASPLNKIDDDSSEDEAKFLDQSYNDFKKRKDYESGKI